ncbi:MAG: site-specific integrase [Muribaculaceae bacterium]
MATANIILDTRRADKNKCYPLKLRIVHKNKNVSISLHKNIPVDSWVLGKNGLEVDKKYPNAKAINLDLSATLVKANQAISDLEKSCNINSMTAVQVKDYILNRSANTGERLTFISYFREFAEKRNAKGTQGIYLNTLNKVIMYSNDYLMFDDITYSWLSDFNAHLKKKGNAINTIAIDERNIRAVIKSAIDEELTDTKDPFRKYKIKQRAESDTMPLTVEKIKAIRDFQTDSEALAIARDAFMASFYLIGINISDLYDLKKGEKVRYIRHKTGKLIDFSMQPEAIELSKKYEYEERMFNFHKRYSSSESFKSRINMRLKIIGEAIGVPNLIMYHARHTWATFATQLDILERTISESMGHSVKSTTNRYARFDSRKIDEANRMVLDLLL